jgi:uncharacterized membrane protein
MSGLFDAGWLGFEPLLADFAVILLLIACIVLTVLFAARARRRAAQARESATSPAADAREARFMDDIFSGEQFKSWSPLHLLRARYAHGDLDDETYRRRETELRERAG